MREDNFKEILTNRYFTVDELTDYMEKLPFSNSNRYFFVATPMERQETVVTLNPDKSVFVSNSLAPYKAEDIRFYIDEEFKVDGGKILPELFEVLDDGSLKIHHNTSINTLVVPVRPKDEPHPVRIYVYTHGYMEIAWEQKDWKSVDSTIDYHRVGEEEL